MIDQDQTGRNKTTNKEDILLARKNRYQGMGPLDVYSGASDKHQIALKRRNFVCYNDKGRRYKNGELLLHGQNPWGQVCENGAEEGEEGTRSLRTKLLY